MKIKDLPKEIKELVLKRQEEQGNIMNEDLNVESSRLEGNFNWSRTKEGSRFWSEIDNGNFDIFYIRYPKKSEYPKVMYVSHDEDFRYSYRRVVFMEKLGKFIAWDAITIEDSENTTYTSTWEYAKDIEILTITKKQVADKFGVDINDLIIE